MRFDLDREYWISGAKNERTGSVAVAFSASDPGDFIDPDGEDVIVLTSNSVAQLRAALTGALTHLAKVP